jgi:hypothetical protein
MWTELLADPSFDAVRMYRCSRNGTHQRSDGDTCSQQLPSTEELSSTSSSDATNDGDAVPAINIALGQRMMSLVAPAAKCSYKPLPAGWPQLAFVHVAETAMKSFAEVGVSIYLGLTISHHCTSTHPRKPTRICTHAHTLMNRACGSSCDPCGLG